MIRLLTKSPVLMGIFPFTQSDNPYDKPVNTVVESLNDELGWDRVKNMFSLDGNGAIKRELQSIINITLSGAMLGFGVAGMLATKSTVDNFIQNNEATRFPSHFDAKRSLQTAVVMDVLKKGGRTGGKLGLFCFLFSSITTCTSVYRGKLAVENYMLGGSITGLMFRINMGLRAALVGTGAGGVLGGLCGGISVLILKLSGITIDEVLDSQKQWMESRAKSREKIKECMSTELPEIKKLYEENRRIQNTLHQQDIENKKK